MRQFIMARRYFISSVAGLATILLFGRVRFSMPKVPADDPDFVIINGWVLTREDVAASKVKPDAI